MTTRRGQDAETRRLCSRGAAPVAGTKPRVGNRPRRVSPTVTHLARPAGRRFEGVFFPADDIFFPADDIFFPADDIFFPADDIFFPADGLTNLSLKGVFPVQASKPPFPRLAQPFPPKTNQTKNP